MVKLSIWFIYVMDYPNLNPLLQILISITRFSGYFGGGGGRVYVRFMLIDNPSSSYKQLWRHAGVLHGVL